MSANTSWTKEWPYNSCDRAMAYDWSDDNDNFMEDQKHNRGEEMSECKILEDRTH